MEVCFPREKIHEDRVSLHAGIESAEEWGHNWTGGKVKRIKDVCCLFGFYRTGAAVYSIARQITKEVTVM